MDPNKEIEMLGQVADRNAEEGVSVDDFIKELEAKEKDLHITSDANVIEISEDLDEELPEFMKGDFEFAPADEPLVSEAPSKPKHEKRASKLEIEIAELKEKLAGAEADRDEMMHTAQRRSRDFESFKLRTERERRETFSTQVGNLATQLLPVLDNLNRALDFTLTMSEEKRNEIQQFLDGIVLVNQQVNEVLAEMGVQPIIAIGETFDPHLHEAVATEETDELPPNTISSELLRGYRIGDRVIRHSMVKVARGAAGDDQVEAAEGNEETEPATVEEVGTTDE